MGLPHKLQFMACPYNIEYFPKKEGEDAGDMGELLEGMDIIRVRNDVSPQRQVEVLLHESIHIMLMSLGLEDEQEEIIISTLSEHLVQFMSDNPTFILYALSGLNKSE